MKVNINGIEYDSEETPILITLSESDKKNISNMHEDKFKYICYPDTLGWNGAKKILNVDESGNLIK